MKFKMAPNSLFAILLRSPWWISFLIAAVVSLICAALLPKNLVVFGVMGTLPFLVTGFVALSRLRLKVIKLGRADRFVFTCLEDFDSLVVPMRNYSFQRWFSVLICFGLTACATKVTYDLEAKEVAARVISKEIIASREQKVDGNLIAVVPIGGVVVPLYGAATKTEISIYEYTVVDGTGKATKVRSEVSFFEIGQCVNLMTANNPTYPRLAFGAECQGF